MPVDGVFVVIKIADSDSCSAVSLDVAGGRIGNPASDPKADRGQLKAPDAARYKSMTPQVPSADRTISIVSKFFRRRVAACADV